MNFSTDSCLDALQQSGLNTFPESDDGSLWCNVTWDTVLCWPATPANSTAILPCPPLKGLDPTRNITKFCHESGRWMGKTADNFEQGHGWTNFTMCFDQEILGIMDTFDNGTLDAAQDVAKNARIMEFVGLGLSLISLAFCVLIFSCFRRLRVFPYHLHLHLLIAILWVVLIRLIMYLDLAFIHQINSTVIICETGFFLLEYFKSVGFCWLLLMSLHLHNQLVFAVFDTNEPKLWAYLLAGYGIPLVNTFIWLLVMVLKNEGKVDSCLGSYYLETEFYILEAPRMLQLFLSILLLGNVIRMFWLKDHHTRNSIEIDRMKWSMKAALLLILILGIPSIMQAIPFVPTKENIFNFTVWTYLTSFTYMFQGFMIAMIYLFTNHEIKGLLKEVLHNRELTRSNAAGHRRSFYSVNDGKLIKITSETDEEQKPLKEVKFEGSLLMKVDDSTSPKNINGKSPVKE